MKRVKTSDGAVILFLPGIFTRERPGIVKIYICKWWKLRRELMFPRNEMRGEIIEDYF